MHSAYTAGGERTLKLPLRVDSSFPSLCSCQGPAMEGLNLVLFFFYLDIEAKPNIQIQLDHLVRRGKEQTEHGWPVLAL